MAFATVSDLEARWRDLSDTEEARAAVLIDDASAMLTAFVDVDPNDEAQAANLKIVTCNMVQRVMASSVMDNYGVTQRSMTAVGFTESMSYSNPTGDMYITKQERRLLKISNCYIGSIEPRIGGTDD